VKKTVGKGLIAVVAAILPTILGAAIAIVGDPTVAPALERAWPALPIALIVGVLDSLNNWMKNRGRK
jgi:hypothetical protein